MASTSESLDPTNDYFTRLEKDDEDGNAFSDKWTSGELLCLASAVQRSGDKNWNSVSRSVKHNPEPKRPTDWYLPKNCALQYAKLLKGVEDIKQKSLPRIERETSEDFLVKNLTDKRVNELKWSNDQTLVLAKSMNVLMDLVDTGGYDEELEELMNHIEEQEKKEEEQYLAWINKRVSLNAAKKLNKRRLPHSKVKMSARSIDNRCKNSPKPDLENTSATSIETEVEPDQAILKPVETMQEISSVPFSYSAILEDSKALDIGLSPSAPITPTSPLLTSLLRSVPSSNASSPVVSHVSSPLKEGDGIDSKNVEIDMTMLIDKSHETSPRSTSSHSPRPTPASSPLLNSLLKSLPSSVSSLPSLQLSQNKEAGSVKTVSPPQSFFSPTNPLVTAAAQELAVATSSFSTSPIFFHQDTSESPRRPIQTTTVTSVCLSAPTLSKLLEMPPSAPGKLPPLPVVETPSALASTSEQIPPKIPTATMLLNELELQLTSETLSPSKIATESIVPEASTATGIVEEKEIPASSNVVEQMIPLEHSAEIRVPLEYVDLLKAVDAVYESYKPTEETKESKSDDNNLLDKSKSETIEKNVNVEQIHTKVSYDEILDVDVDIEKLLSTSNIVFDEKVFTSEDISVNVLPALKLSQDDKQKSDFETDNLNEIIQEHKVDFSTFYQLLNCPKNQISSEKNTEKSTETASSVEIDAQKTLKTTENETEDFSEVPVSEQLLLAAKAAEDATLCKFSDNSPTKLEIKSPASKNPRLFEKVDTEEEIKDLNQNETSVVKRSGRKAKMQVYAKSTPVKQDEPKDQYEFSESTEENSIGYQTSTLCYMPRLKDDESKIKQPQNSESSTVVESAASEKKHESPAKKSTRFVLFETDEELSDSDGASISHFDDDKLGKLKDFSKKKEENYTESLKDTKIVDGAKKKMKRIKRNLLDYGNMKKVKKNVEFDDYESSILEIQSGSEDTISSEDSEDTIRITAWQREEAELFNIKKVDSNVANEAEMEANDSHISSSMTVESENKMEEMEEECKTLKGSHIPALEEFGKQDWFQGACPKSSEAVSQSSEESESESNWDNQSVDANKSASHSAGTSSKPERMESAQYKAWKKSISIVLREASCHKYANVFLQKVTNDVAAGYSNVVYRPMDLSQLKKNVDNGVVKTTAEVHRDMLLMFQNAIMYNSSDHDVHHMAVEMQGDVIEQIQAFLATQYDDKNENNELTSLRGARAKKVYGSTLKSKEVSREKE